VDGVSVAVLAGGRSRRFGSDKRLVELDGVTLLGRTLALAGGLGEDLLVVVADEADAGRLSDVLAAHRSAHGGHDGALRVVTDTRTGIGPLAGLEAALTAARHELVLVLAADHPLLTEPLLRLLLDTARRVPDARVVAIEGSFGPEPMLAVYRRAAVADISAGLDEGVRHMVRALTQLRPHVIPQAQWRAVDPTGSALVDIDTPDELP
jgi:molybdopterin-guanine dinucleotide biosynthesis protein A